MDSTADSIVQEIQII